MPIKEFKKVKLAKLQRTGGEKLIDENSKHIFGGLEAEGVVVTHLDQWRKLSGRHWQRRP